MSKFSVGKKFIPKDYEKNLYYLEVLGPPTSDYHGKRKDAHRCRVVYYPPVNPWTDQKESMEQDYTNPHINKYFVEAKEGEVEKITAERSELCMRETSLHEFYKNNMQRTDLNADEKEEIFVAYRDKLFPKKKVDDNPIG